MDFKPIFECTNLTNGRVDAKASGRGEKNWLGLALSRHGRGLQLCNALSRLASGIQRRVASAVAMDLLASYEKTQQPEGVFNS